MSHLGEPLEFQRARRIPLGIDLTPMIDCVFQLLVFFLLTSSFVTPTVRLDLPDASAENPVRRDPIVVTIDQEGKLFVGREPVERERVAAEVLERLRQANDEAVTLRVDREIPYEQVLSTLLELREAGVMHIHLAYEQS